MQAYGHLLILCLLNCCPGFFFGQTRGSEFYVDLYLCMKSYLVTKDLNIKTLVKKNENLFYTGSILFIVPI